MARRKRAMQDKAHAVNSPETVYVRHKAAQWLLAVLDKGAEMDSSFFECLDWALGGLGELMEGVSKESAALRSAPGKEAREAVQMLLASTPKHRLWRACDDLIDDHPCMKDIFLERIGGLLRSMPEASCPFFRQAQSRLESVFGLDADSSAICEFTFLLQSFHQIESYFEDTLKVFHFTGRPLLAHMLGLSQTGLSRRLDELVGFGILEDSYGHSFRIIEAVLPFWSQEKPDSSLLFSRPLEGDSLPLSSFRIDPDEVRHIRRLMESRGDSPVHILLYGVSGTGKTSFARSLAEACGVKAWSVNSRRGDDDSQRRASLAACLHMASKHEGSFVVVDEAERLLDTDLAFGRQTKDKAWLNDFLEKPGQRIIWISNKVEHIDPAVRRRFAYSLHFEPLSVQQRVDLWREVMKREGISRRFHFAVAASFSFKYPVEAAVIQKAVTQSARLYRGRREFWLGVERILQAHLALQNGGSFKPKEMCSASKEFTLSGVCMEGDAEAFIARCRRVDDAMRSGQELRPGCGTMLFYGPPGTGKTELARHIADELSRECLVKRASDLLSPYVGMAEQQVAEAFREAEKSGAVLVIDEADTFLYSRESAQHSWESSLVNEFLTALERCQGFCICTTNRREQLDPAAMRRFSHKLEFRYADSEQVLALYEALLAPLCEGGLPDDLRRRLTNMSCLAPGDFHAVRAQYDPLFTAPGETTHGMLVTALEKEAGLKIEPKARRVGFLG